MNVFDLIKESEATEVSKDTTGDKGKSENLTVFDISETADVSPSDVPWYKSIPLDVLKGLIEGTVAFGRAFGPTELPEQRQDIKPLLDKSFPSTSSNVAAERVGGALRRGAALFPIAATNPIGASTGLAAGQSAAGGALGEGVDYFGGGETLQSIAEVLPFFFGGGSGKIQPKKAPISSAVEKLPFIPEKIKNIFSKKVANADEINQLIAFAEKEGMTAEQIAPLIQGDWKKTVLSKISTRGRRVQGKLSDTYEAIGDIMNRFKTGSKSEVVLGEVESSKLVSKLQDVLYEMPSKVRNTIMQDFEELLASPKDVKSIINFYRDVSANFGKNKKQLELLKEPLRNALATVDPSLANDFNLANKLYQKYIDISSRLKPSVASDILEMTTIPKVTYGLATGNFPLVAEAIGEQGARLIAAEALTNPRLMNISRKLINALNKNQISIANRLREDYIRAVKDEYPDVAHQIQKEKF